MRAKRGCGNFSAFDHAAGGGESAGAGGAAGNPADDVSPTAPWRLDHRIKTPEYGGMVFLTVVDEAGNELHAQEDKAPQFWRRGRNQWGWMEGTPLKIPEKLGTKIVSAKGVVHMMVQLAEVSTEVAEIDKNWKKPVSVGGMTVMFSAFDAPGDRLNFSAAGE